MSTSCRRETCRFWLAGATATALMLGSAIASTFGGQANTAATSYAPGAFNALEWRLIGPFRGGRSVAVAGSAARPNEYYHGTTGGGVFKTTNGGLSWFPVTDTYFGGTIGAIAVSDSNPDVVYVGTGERSLRGNLSHGDGMFKSTDGARTCRLNVNGQAQTETLTVEADPRLEATAADYVAKFEMLQKIVARVSEANNGVRTIRNVKAQFTQRSSALPADRRAEFERLSSPIVESLTSIEGKLYQLRGRGMPVQVNDKLARLADIVDETDGRPTSQVAAVYDVPRRTAHGIGELTRRHARTSRPRERLLARGWPARDRARYR